jgi:DNA polymerase-3 subunit delta'
MTNSLTSFDDILGQTAAIEALTSAYKVDRLPHGLIFAGPQGVGKGTTARALGALFLCEKPKGLEPCGKCQSCTAFAAGNHPDFHVIYRQLARLEKEERKARDITADVIREFLISKAANKSVVGIGKVFVIEEADLMNTTAQNALLKTLEEPAGRTLIILLTDQPDSMLPTIRSRCRLIQFAQLDEKLVRDQLVKRGFDKESASRAASYSEGSLGLAIHWLEDGVIDRATELTQRLGKILAGGGVAELPEFLKTSAEAYAAKQLERDERASKDQLTREGMVLYLRLVAQFFRRRMVQIEDDPDQLERACAAIDAVVRAEGYVESNVNIPLVLQQFAVALEGAVH